MARPRILRKNRLAPDAEELLLLARSLAMSSSRLEDAFWESRLSEVIDRLLSCNDDESLNAALDNLSKTDSRACDVLADTIESRCESRPVGTKGEQSSLLIAAPVLAWSRYSIPAGQIPADILSNIRVQLSAHVLASDVLLGLADVLFSPDQLPQGFVDCAGLNDKLVKSALASRDLHIDVGQLGQTINFLSDTRYVVGVVIAKPGAPLFRWQEADGGIAMRDQAALRWREQGGGSLRPLLPACAGEALLPMAFYSACRDADRQSRPYSIRASVAFLGTTVNIEANQLSAVVAPFQDNRIDEYRIGFVHKTTGDLVHGVVWPLLDTEDDNETPAMVEAALRECGIGDIKVIGHTFPLEYCDDCGTPLYPNCD